MCQVKPTPNDAQSLFKLAPGMYMVHCQLWIAPDRRPLEHWASYDAFRKALYSGDGDIILLDDEDIHDPFRASTIYKLARLCNIRRVYCMMKYC
jgi:hypothetical protein